MSRTVALNQTHIDAGATLVDFGGWQMPVSYSGTVAEHTAVREGVGVFDVSHMGTARVVGRGARAALNAVLANDLMAIDAGTAQYTLLCNASGGAIDDLIAYVISDDEVLLVPNAANSDEVLAVLRTSMPSHDVIDLRPDRVMLAVQGPRSADVLAAVGLPTHLDYMAFTYVNEHAWNHAGAPWDCVVVCRTGYTGERGFEVLVPVAHAQTAWDAFVAAGALPCGLGARDTLRLEMGYALHGHELSPEISPVQAGLVWAVGWDKPAFHGRDALLAERAAGPQRRLRGLLALERGIPRADMPVLSAAGGSVGTTTSGTFSPTLQQGIALALLDPAIALGDEVVIDVRGRHLRAQVVRPPFVAASPR